VSNLLLSHGRRLSNERNAPLAELGIAPARFAEVAGVDRRQQDRRQQRRGGVRPACGAGRAGRAGRDAARALQVSDAGAIDAAIDKLIAENSKSLQDYRAGKQAALGSLMGMVMKSAKGLNPKLVQERLKAEARGVNGGRVGQEPDQCYVAPPASTVRRRGRGPAWMTRGG
jgi:Asp-tRNA(Asn)/Glu-tRNA(Gln) amidotransferase B subunit